MKDKLRLQTLEAVRMALRVFVRSLSTSTKFNLIQFGSEHRMLFPVCRLVVPVCNYYLQKASCLVSDNALLAADHFIDSLKTASDSPLPRN